MIENIFSIARKRCNYWDRPTSTSIQLAQFIGNFYRYFFYRSVRSKNFPRYVVTAIIVLTINFAITVRIMQIMVDCLNEAEKIIVGNGFKSLNLINFHIIMKWYIFQGSRIPIPKPSTKTSNTLWKKRRKS